MKRVIGVLFAAAVLSACVTMSKRCFGNGVCRTEVDGKVTWEGPPEEVARLQAAEEEERRAAAERDAAFAAAPRRAPQEPIRVAVVGPLAGPAQLQSFVPLYTSMLHDALQGDPRIQLVPATRIQHLLRGESSSFGRRNGEALDLDAALARRVRDGSGEVDVLLVVSVGEKTRTGMVRGGGGAGMAQVVNVEFKAQLSPVYAFRERTTSEVGNSTSGIALAGVGKNGKASNAELKSPRNPEQDQEAVRDLANWVKRTAVELSATELPSLGAVAEINQKLVARRGEQLKNALQQATGQP